jgi:hypothetical protein
MKSKEINSRLQQLTRRAERNDPATLKETFVSVGGIEHALLNRDHKIMFGRRGTGKTYALYFVAETANQRVISLVMSICVL